MTKESVKLIEDCIDNEVKVWTMSLREDRRSINRARVELQAGKISNEEFIKMLDGLNARIQFEEEKVAEYMKAYIEFAKECEK